MGCISPWRFDSSQPHRYWNARPAPAGRRRSGQRRRAPTSHRGPSGVTAVILTATRGLPPTVRTRSSASWTATGSRPAPTRVTASRTVTPGRPRPGAGARRRRYARSDEEGRPGKSRRLALAAVAAGRRGGAAAAARRAGPGARWPDRRRPGPRGDHARRQRQLARRVLAGNRVKPTLPLERDDPAEMAGFGWNSVRLIVSWSRVEPKPGQYDEHYLDRVEKWVRRFADERLYTIIDFHQDAWGATLAARPDETCPAGYEPAFGWDGAPGWATLDEDQPRCFLNAREINPAVSAAWRNFFADAHGPGGIGVQTRYTRMLAHVAERFAGNRSVAGIDVMNEPDAFGAEETGQLGDVLRAVDGCDQARRTSRRRLSSSRTDRAERALVADRSGAPSPFDHDRNLVYSPHLYGGSIGGEGPPSEAQFETARRRGHGELRRRARADR